MSDYPYRTCGNDLPKKTENISSNYSKKIEITIAVFFDGTLNNKYNIKYATTHKNTEGKNDEKDDSYKGSYSNVVELFECYDADPNSKDIGKVYIEGIGSAEPKSDGTSSEKTDYTRGYAFGTGDTGINGKIERGCILIKNEFDKKTRGNNNTSVTFSLILDVYGFSRGAAAARSFVSRIDGIKSTSNTEDKKVSLRHHIPMTLVQEIKVRFLGLFDTVSSYSPGKTTLSEFDNDVEELSLKIPSSVQKTVHLVAADEYREYFALTTIKSAADGKKVEVVLPGAHSDIGGGYASVEKEKITEINDILGQPYTGSRDCRGYMSLEELYKEQWIPSTWRIDSKSLMPKPSRFDILNYYGRDVKNDYAKIPLKMMAQYANDQHKCFLDDNLNDISYIDNAKLSAIRDRIILIVNGGASLYSVISSGIFFVGSPYDTSMKNNIRAEYQHLSARHEFGHYATKDNRRIIIDG